MKFDDSVIRQTTRAAAAMERAGIAFPDVLSVIYVVSILLEAFLLSQHHVRDPIDGVLSFLRVAADLYAFKLVRDAIRRRREERRRFTGAVTLDWFRGRQSSILRLLVLADVVFDALFLVTAGPYHHLRVKFLLYFTQDVLNTAMLYGLAISTPAPVQKTSRLAVFGRLAGAH